jgi:probable phosphoglycerate mutase
MPEIVLVTHDRTVVASHGGASSYVVLAWLGVSIESVGSMRFAFGPFSITRLRAKANGDRYVESLDAIGHLGR